MDGGPDQDGCEHDQKPRQQQQAEVQLTDAGLARIQALSHRDDDRGGLAGNFDRLLRHPHRQTSNREIGEAGLVDACGAQDGEFVVAGNQAVALAHAVEDRIALRAVQQGQGPGRYIDSDLGVADGYGFKDGLSGARQQAIGRALYDAVRRPGPSHQKHDRHQAEGSDLGDEQPFEQAVRARRPGCGHGSSR
ncbi:hypothetical protein D3C87_1391680 [compost metagenome]